MERHLLVRSLARVYGGAVRLRLVLLLLAADAHVSFFKCKDLADPFKWKDFYFYQAAASWKSWSSRRRASSSAAGTATSRSDLAPGRGGPGHADGRVGQLNAQRIEIAVTF